MADPVERKFLDRARASKDDAILFRFVFGDDDVVGLVAFAIHEQQVNEWREAFQLRCGREPRPEEAKAYAIGETTPRRLLAYRYLAKSRLSGRGPDLIPNSAKASFILSALRSAGWKRSPHLAARQQSWA